MSADIALPSSPPTRISTAGSTGSSDQQSSGSSSLRLSDEHDKKSPPSSSSLTGSYLQRLQQRRRSDGTETGSIGYGSSAPLESETSYSSHPGYPTKIPGSSMTISSPKSPCSPACSASSDLQISPHQQLLQRNHQSQQNSSSSPSQSSSSPSTGLYVAASSALPPYPGSFGSSGSRRTRNALINSRTNTAVSPVASSASCNGSYSTESETGYVVDAEKGTAYYKGQLLGKGGFARVYLITDIASRKQYACKIIPKYQMQKIHMEKIAREIMIHKELNHVNVVQMHHYFEDTLNVYMLLEACPKKSLVHVLKYRGKVTEPEARYYMKQMVAGVAYIHSQKVIHRDLKPGNMLLSDRMIVKIGDFGLATQPVDGQRKRVTICGTPNFIAPEVLFKQSYSYEADVWALGCILYHLLVGQPPFDSSTLKETYARICNNRYKKLDDTMASRAGQDLVRWLLQPDPELRPSLELVKEHPYLTKEYVPTSLPDSCYYQAPRLSFTEKPSALTNFSSNLNFSQPHNNNNNNHVNREHPQNQNILPSDSKKSKSSVGTCTKKKKVSSWLASWKLPKLPRFRQRISSVLCLEARKKQQHPAIQDSNGNKPANGALPVNGSTPILLMSRALEDCLAAAGRGSARMRASGNPPALEDYSPLFITKWIDYSNKYGLAFQLSDRSVGVLFNDSTKMSYTHDRRRVEYITAENEITTYNRERNIPPHLQEKLELLRHFTDYMDKHLTEGGEVTGDNRGTDVGRRPPKSVVGVPRMRRWLRTSKAIVMELSVPLLQINFFDDHTKLIVSQEPSLKQADGNNQGYLVTYIDCERRASTYWLNDLKNYGCSPELHERLHYVFKVAKEFSEFDIVQAH